MKDRYLFRAWDKTENKMHYNDFVITATGFIAKLQNLYEPKEDDDDAGEIIENQFYIDQTDLSQEKNFIKMQCTGLKDKNGKLIFEGDIFEPDPTEQEYSSYVVWDNESASFKIASSYIDDHWNGLYSEAFDRTNLFDFDDYHIEAFKIIGNIYEHSHLLEGGAECQK